MDKKKTLVEIVNILGSIASITGISLLWLKDNNHFSPMDILAISVAVSFCLGLATLGVVICRYFYYRWFSQKDLLVKITYFALAIPIISCLMIMIVLFINKVVISTRFEWFFNSSF
jgi:hypothetical protein